MEYESWFPLKGVNGNFYLEELRDDSKVLKILLKNDETDDLLHISFDAALTYRNIDEGYLLKSLEYIKGGFFKMVVSDYLTWFHDEGHGIMRDDDEVVHYAIYTPNDCIDVISQAKPRVEWL